MYKALYRKYRPHDFASVCGQEHIVKILENSIENNKIAHAYLFTGSRGTGKTTSAKIFARMINCLNMTNGHPCGNCQICLNENTDEIPDIIEIDAASNNGVDEIRELRNKVKLVPTMCKYKVYIIDEVHMLSIGAFNALLKTLEEPPEHVVFILATTDPQKIPITVISRCQRFDFKKISEKEIVKRLKQISKEEKIDISDETLQEIANLSDGALRDAIGLLEQLYSFKNKDINIDDLYAINGNISIKEQIELIKFYFNKDYENIIKFIDEYNTDGKNFQLLANDLLNIFKDILICKKAISYFKNEMNDRKKLILELSNNIELEELENIIIELEDTIRLMKESNKQRIHLELFFLKSNYQKKININEIPIVKNNNEIKNTNLNVFVSNKDNALSNFKDIIINNTICEANTAKKTYLKEILENINETDFAKENMYIIEILNKSEVVAASQDHAILTFPYSEILTKFDNSLKEIHTLLFNLTNIDYKLVGILTNEWNDIRPKYVKMYKENKIIKIPENFNKTKIEEDFQNVIEEE